MGLLSDGEADTHVLALCAGCAHFFVITKADDTTRVLKEREIDIGLPVLQARKVEAIKQPRCGHLVSPSLHDAPDLLCAVPSLN